MRRKDRHMFVAAVGGGSLLALGIREATILSAADLETAQARARQLGLTRIAAGVALLARPQLLTGALGLDSENESARWLPRLMAVREIALGVGTLVASRRSADPWPWLMTIAAVDGAEAAVLALALRGHAVDPLGGWAFVAADVGSAVAAPVRVARLAWSGVRQADADSISAR